jgi:hypothetical protein
MLSSEHVAKDSTLLPVQSQNKLALFVVKSKLFVCVCVDVSVSECDKETMKLNKRTTDHYTVSERNLCRTPKHSNGPHPLGTSMKQPAMSKNCKQTFLVNTVNTLLLIY